MTSENPLPVSPPALGVVLLAGLRSSERSKLAEFLLGAEPGPRRVPWGEAAITPAEEASVAGAAEGAHGGAIVGDEEGDSFSLGIDLADHVIARGQAGQRGTMVVELDSHADIPEVSLVLEHLLLANTEVPCAVGLCELITVAHVGDIRRLLCGGTESESDPDLSEILATQLEFATIVVLSGLEGLEAEDRREIFALVQHLNPSGSIVPLAVALSGVRRVRPVRGAVAGALAATRGWMVQLDEAVPTPERIGAIEALVFRDPRPFHPGRLAAAIAEGLRPEKAGLIMRSRGLFQLASRPEVVGSWASAGALIGLEPTAMLSGDVESPAGQEIVFFGRGLHREALFGALEASLLTMEELSAGPEFWVQFPDPLPAWDLSHGH